MRKTEEAEYVYYACLPVGIACRTMGCQKHKTAAVHKLKVLRLTVHGFEVDQFSNVMGPQIIAERHASDTEEGAVAIAKDRAEMHIKHLLSDLVDAREWARQLDSMEAAQ